MLCWRCKETFCFSTTLTKWPDTHNEQCKNITGRTYNTVSKKVIFWKRHSCLVGETVILILQEVL